MDLFIHTENLSHLPSKQVCFAATAAPYPTFGLFSLRDHKPTRGAKILPRFREENKWIYSSTLKTFHICRQNRSVSLLPQLPTPRSAYSPFGIISPHAGLKSFLASARRTNGFIHPH